MALRSPREHAPSMTESASLLTAERSMLHLLPRLCLRFVPGDEDEGEDVFPGDDAEGGDIGAFRGSTRLTRRVSFLLLRIQRFVLLRLLIELEL